MKSPTNWIEIIKTQRS